MLELGSNSCVLIRARTHAGVRDSPGECVSSCSVVLARMEMWDAALKEDVKDIGCEVADITTGFHLIFLQTIVRYSDVKKYTIDQVGLRLCYDQNQWKRASLSITMTMRQGRHLAMMSPIFML